MKRFLLAITASVAIASGAFAASISYTNSAAAAGNTDPVNLALNKFNTGLGTLTGVVVTVNFTTLAGNFTVTASTSTDAKVAENTDPAGRVTIRQNPSNTLGFTRLGQTSFTIVTDPSTPYIVPGNTSKQFLVTEQDVFVNQSQNISSGFWSAYQAAGGAGTINFQVMNSPDIIVGGGAYTLDAIPFTATANMSVTYNYDAAPAPIPEPSTVMAGAFLTLVAAGTYVRRRNSRATPSS